MSEIGADGRLEVGRSASLARTLSNADIEAFARLSGDTNPLHVDEEYAQATLFKGTIAHGMLTASLISALLGTRLPGPGSVYVSQSLKFKRPVRGGDEVEVKATVTALDLAKGLATLATVCKVRGKVVVEGEAVVQPPAGLMPKAAA
jgi:3-hydroxybutyryl-CoA dehydratase